MSNANYNYSLTIGAQLKDTNQIKTQLDKFGESYKLKINVELKNDKLASLNRTINEATDALNRLRGATNNVNGSLQTTNQTSAQLSTHIEQATSSIQELGSRGRQNLDRLNDSQQRLNQHTRTFGDILRTVYQFYIASMPARIMETMVRETISTIKEFDAAITEMGKVSDSSGQQLYEYTQRLGELGAEIAKTQTSMTQMSTEFLKGGYSEEEAAQLSRVAG